MTPTTNQHNSRQSPPSTLQSGKYCYKKNSVNTVEEPEKNSVEAMRKKRQVVEATTINTDYRQLVEDVTSLNLQEREQKLAGSAGSSQ